MLIIAADEQERVEWRPGVLSRLLAGAALGTEQLCLLEQRHEPGCGAPAHLHDGVEELLLVLEGRADVWIGDERATVEAGSAVVVPPSVRHGFSNPGPDPLRILAVLAAAEPPVEYEEEAGTVFEIGGRGDVRRDAHRAVRGA